MQAGGKPPSQAERVELRQIKKLGAQPCVYRPEPEPHAARVEPCDRGAAGDSSPTDPRAACRPTGGITSTACLDLERHQALSCFQHAEVRAVPAGSEPPASIHVSKDGHAICRPGHQRRRRIRLSARIADAIPRGQFHVLLVKELEFPDGLGYSFNTFVDPDTGEQKTPLTASRGGLDPKTKFSVGDADTSLLMPLSSRSACGNEQGSNRRPKKSCLHSRDSAARNRMRSMGEMGWPFSG